MIFVYILLAIIAVGVLLISEAGREILKWLGWLAVISGLLYLGFWVVVIITPFCQSFWVACQAEMKSNPEGRIAGLKTIVGIVIALIALPFIIIQVFKAIYELIKKIKQK